MFIEPELEEMRLPSTIKSFLPVRRTDFYPYSISQYSLRLSFWAMNHICLRVKDNYNSVQNLWEDSQRIKMREISPMEILVDYLERKGRPQEYTDEFLQDKYLLLNWIATNLLFERPIKTRLLFLYGRSNTQKTLLISLLKKIGLRSREKKEWLLRSPWFLWFLGLRRVHRRKRIWWRRAALLREGPSPSSWWAGVQARCQIWKDF